MPEEPSVSPVRITPTTRKVLDVMLEDPARRLRPLDLLDLTGVSSGVAASLRRLLAAGWITALWEPPAGGGPGRVQTYALTPGGLAAAQG